MSLKKLYPSLDGIRGIAAALILIRHTGLYFKPIDFNESYLGVDLFFVLSGFVLGNAYDQKLRSTLSGTRFMLLRIIRLYPLYLLGFVFALVVELMVLRSGLSGGRTPAALVMLTLGGLLMLPRFGGQKPFSLNPPAWSLFCELVANFIYAYTARKLSTRVLWICLTFFGSCLLVTAFVAHHVQPAITLDNFNVGYKAILRVLYPFTAGLLIYRYQHVTDSRWLALPRRYPELSMTLIILVLVLILTADPAPGLRLPFDLLIALAGFPLLLVITLAADHAARANAVFRVLGSASYGLYVLHEPFSRLVARCMVQFLGVNPGDYAPWAGLVLLATLIPLCWYLEQWFDLPVRRALAKRLRKPAAAVPEPQLVPEPERVMAA